MSIKLWNGDEDIPYSADNTHYLMINSCSVDNHRLQKETEFIIDRTRDDWYLVYYISGESTVYFNQEKHTAGAGQLLLYEPKEPQKIIRHKKSAAVSYYLHFTGYAVRDMLRECGLTHSGIYSVGENLLISDTFVHIIAAFNLRNDPSYVNYLFFKLLMHIGESLKAASPHVPITANFDGKILIGLLRLLWNSDIKNTNQIIAQYANFSDYELSQFAESFKKATGKSPAKYKTDIKIAKAANLLLTTSLSISQIAVLAGYNDPFYFSRAFKKHMGVSPREYRKQNPS